LPRTPGREQDAPLSAHAWRARSRKGLSEKDARWFFKQLMLALDYCHKMVRRRRRRGLPLLAAGRLLRVI
jgi:hypothetical protein